MNLTERSPWATLEGVTMSGQKILRIYETESGKRPFEEWLNDLRDPMTRARILTRLDRVAIGDFGDIKPVGEGVFELRFSFSAGFRVYYGLDGETLVVLLLAGDKSSQEKDIANAKEYWADYKESQE